MDHVGEVRDLLAEIQGHCSSGFAVALHISFSTPRFLFQTYDPVWSKVYSERGFVVQDPTVKWGLEHEGGIDWDDLTDADPANVIGQAKEHGIGHGFTLSVLDEGSRSMGSFTHGDTPFDLETKKTLEDLFRKLHRITQVEGETKKEISDALKRLSVEFTHGF